MKILGILTLVTQIYSFSLLFILRNKEEIKDLGGEESKMKGLLVSFLVSLFSSALI